MVKRAKNKKDYTYAVGRRKTASARVRLYVGKGDSLVNGISVEKFFSDPNDVEIWKRPFRVLDVSDKYFITVKVKGGGKNGQVEAISHGISRALEKINKDFRIPLKKAGLLTRDPRERERRKVNTGGKARRKRQSPKR
jgi:small subunit ribosomal protein S9